MRKVLLTVHVATSVGWLGLDGALVALEVTGLSNGDPGERAGIAAAMTGMVLWVMVPVVFAALVSGLALALSTPWGLAQHWWVLIKCGIASVLTAAGLMVMLPRLGQIIAGAAEPIRMETLIGRSVALGLLLAATGLSVVKPWGKTPRGRRRVPLETRFSRSSGTAAPQPSSSPRRAPNRR